MQYVCYVLYVHICACISLGASMLYAVYMHRLGICNQSGCKSWFMLGMPNLSETTAASHDFVTVGHDFATLRIQLTNMIKIVNQKNCVGRGSASASRGDAQSVCIFLWRYKHAPIALSNLKRFQGLHFTHDYLELTSLWEYDCHRCWLLRCQWNCFVVTLVG